ncbi:MAG: sulfonate transport system substrate-binding protein [Solirubrobacteraceae bacterium]|nr:sulfonate transport system substrate-binding protein [Solirubrobacteraceae bacterium]
MFKRALTAGVTAAALAASLAACGSSSGSNASNASASSGLPTVTMMVGGIDKQIYLPYQLAQDLGYFKKYGVNMQLSTEQSGGVGAETAMASGQVDMAGAWYVHTIDFQQQGKAVVDLVNLSGAPGEREMCTKGSNVTSAAQWKGKIVGVTDIGSGTDNLTRYLAARSNLTTRQFSRAAVGDGQTFLASLQHRRIVCGMTTQPTVSAIESQGVGYSAIDLASTAATQAALGGVYPAAGVLARAEWVSSHKAIAQKVVDAMVATMHWIATHSATDIADHLPPAFVSNGLITKSAYVNALAKDKGQFLPDGIMPPSGPTTALAIDKLAGNVSKPVDLAPTWTNSYAIAANKLEGSMK